MGKQLFTNNAKSTLSGTLPQAGVTLVCAAGQGSRFPTPTGGDFFYLTVYTKDVYTNEQEIEVVKVTARAGDVMTVERDIEALTGNAGGYAYNGSTTTVFLELRWTAGCAGNMSQASEAALLAPKASPSFSGTLTHSGYMGIGVEPTGKFHVATPTTNVIFGHANGGNSYLDGSRFAFRNIGADEKFVIDTNTGAVSVLGSLTVQSATGAAWAAFGTSAVSSSYMVFKKGGTQTAIGYLGTDGSAAIGGGAGDNLFLRAENALGFLSGGAEALRLSGADQSAAFTGTVTSPNPFAYKNFFSNGDFQVDQYQRKNISTTPQYAMDRWLMHFSGGTGHSGTIGSTGGAGGPATQTALMALNLGCTASQIFTMQRIEAARSVVLNGRQVTIQFFIYHDWGVTPDFVIHLYKAQNRNNFGSNTFLGTSPPKPCASGAYTRISHTFTLGSTDASDGIMVLLTPNAVHTLVNKSFLICEAQMELGNKATTMEHVPYPIALQDCQWYFKKIHAEPNMPIGHGVSYDSTTGLVNLPFEQMRVAPTLTSAGVFQLMNGSWGAQSVTALNNNGSSTDNMLLAVNCSAGLTVGQVCTLLGGAVTAGDIYLNSEL